MYREVAVKKKLSGLLAVIITVFLIGLLAGCQYSLETRFLADPGSDPTPPEIMSTNPARDDHLETLAAVSLTFSEEVIGADNLVNYSLSGSGSGTLSLNSVTDMGGNTFQIALTGSTIDGTININIGGITDLAGNLMLPDTVSYLGWWDTDWSNRMKLSIDNSAQTEDLIDFTALVKLDNIRVDYTVAQGNGQDVRFLDDSRNIMPFETERWDTSGTSSLWVMLPDIPAGSTSDFIWMYYGNPAAVDGQDSSNTWDNDFGAVWHFNSVTGSTGDVLDSSGNGQVADSNNIGPVVSSDIGFGYAFDGSTSWVDPGASDTYFSDEIFNRTVEIRFRADRVTGIQTLYEEGGGTNGLFIGLDDDPAVNPGVPSIIASSRDGGASFQRNAHTSFNDTSTFHSIVAVFDGTNLYQYLDGIGGSVLTGYASIGGHSGDPGVGRTPDSDSYGNGSGIWFQGTIDEMRISDVPRSTDWINAQNLSMNDNFILYTAE